MNEIEYFEAEKHQNIVKMGGSPELKTLSATWFEAACRYRYSYHFSWMGRPIIQFPQDMAAMQELIWQVQPDLIVETGIAHGGSLVFYAAMLELTGKGEVLGIDIDIRAHNRKEIERHPMAKRIQMLQGSSIDRDICDQVYARAKEKKSVMVILDSNHTHDHVRQELDLYAPLVSLNSYLVVFDTVVEDLPDDFFPDRPWGKGNNPKTAVWDFLKNNDQFVIDEEMNRKLLITAAPDGFLKRVSI